MDKLVFSGSLNTVGKNDRIIELVIKHNDLHITGLTLDAIIKSNYSLPDDNGVYILESDEQCYVGQSKNLRDRLKNHINNKKINLNRLFFLSKSTDIRGYLDYMEKRLYKSMVDEGYNMANGTNLDPDSDRLGNGDKGFVNGWIKEFISFLPVLGFKKEGASKLVIKNKNPKCIKDNLTNKTELTNTIKTNNDEILAQQPSISLISPRERMIELIKQHKLSELLAKLPNTKSCSFSISPFVVEYTGRDAQTLTNYHGEKIYYHLNLGNKEILKRISKIDDKNLTDTINKISKKNDIRTSSPNIELFKNPRRNYLVSLLDKFSLKDLLNNNKINDTTLEIKTEPFISIYNTSKEGVPNSKMTTNFLGEQIHFHIHMSNDTLDKKIRLLENLLSSK